MVFTPIVVELFSLELDTWLSKYLTVLAKLTYCWTVSKLSGKSLSQLHLEMLRTEPGTFNMWKLPQRMLRMPH